MEEQQWERRAQKSNYINLEVLETVNKCNMKVLPITAPEFVFFLNEE